MKISGNSSNNNNRKVENRGDVTRELLETSDIITTIVPNRLLNANAKNGVGRLHSKTKHKDSLKGRVRVEPPAGGSYIAGQKVFRKQTRAGGYDGRR